MHWKIWRKGIQLLFHVVILLLTVMINYLSTNMIETLIKWATERSGYYDLVSLVIFLQVSLGTLVDAKKFAQKYKRVNL